MKTKQEIENRIKEIKTIINFKVESIERGAKHMTTKTIISDLIDIETLKAHRSTLEWTINQEDDF